jgi:hypothetical protein
MSFLRVRDGDRGINNDDDLLISPGVSEPREGRYLAVITYALMEPCL